MQQPSNMYMNKGGNQQNGGGGVGGGPTPQQMQSAPMPQQPQQQQQQQQGKSLWIGDVLPYMNEKDIAKQFDKIAHVVNVKLIKDKQTNKPVGYGFVEFQDFETARDVFTTLNGKKIPGQENRFFKLNWASHGGGVARAYNQGQMNYNNGGGSGGMGYNNNNSMGGRPNYPSNHTGGGGGPNNYYGVHPNHQHQQQEAFQVYVGDLDPVVTNHNLLQYFKQIYNSVCEAKVIVDPVSRKSKGYGFIKFLSKDESERALQEMNGKQLYGRAIKMNYASQRTPQNNQNMSNRFSNAGVPPEQLMNGGGPPRHANPQGHFGNQFMPNQGGPFNHSSAGPDSFMNMPQPHFNKTNSSGYTDPSFAMDNLYPNINAGGFGSNQRQPFNQPPGMLHSGMQGMAQGYSGQPNIQNLYNQQAPPHQGIQNNQSNGLQSGANIGQNYVMPHGVNQYNNSKYGQNGNGMNAGQMPNHLMGVQQNMRMGRHPGQQDAPQQFGNSAADFGNPQFKQNGPNSYNNGLNTQKQLSQHALDGGAHGGQDPQAFNGLVQPQMNQKGGIQNGSADLAGPYNPMNNPQKMNEQQANPMGASGDPNNFNNQQNMGNSLSNPNVGPPNAQDGFAHQGQPPNGELPDSNAVNKAAHYAPQGNPYESMPETNYQMPQQQANPEAKSPQGPSDAPNRMHNAPETQQEKADDPSGAAMHKADAAHGYDPLTSVDAKSAPPSSLVPQQDPAGHPGPASSYPLKGDASQQQQEYGRMPPYNQDGYNKMSLGASLEHQGQPQQPHQFYYQQNPPHGYPGSEQQQQQPGMPYDHMAVHAGAHSQNGEAKGAGAAMVKRLAIDPISRDEIARMNKEYLEPLIDNSEVLYIL